MKKLLLFFVVALALLVLALSPAFAQRVDFTFKDLFNMSDVIVRAKVVGGGAFVGELRTIECFKGKAPDFFEVRNFNDVVVDVKLYSLNPGEEYVFFLMEADGFFSALAFNAGRFTVDGGTIHGRLYTNSINVQLTKETFFTGLRMAVANRHDVKFVQGLLASADLKEVYFALELLKLSRGAFDAAPVFACLKKKNAIITTSALELLAEKKVFTKATDALPLLKSESREVANTAALYLASSGDGAFLRPLGVWLVTRAKENKDFQGARDPRRRKETTAYREVSEYLAGAEGAFADDVFLSILETAHEPLQLAALYHLGRRRCLRAVGKLIKLKDAPSYLLSAEAFGALKALTLLSDTSPQSLEAWRKGLKDPAWRKKRIAALTAEVDKNPAAIEAFQLLYVSGEPDIPAGLTQEFWRRRSHTGLPLAAVSEGDSSFMFLVAALSSSDEDEVMTALKALHAYADRLRPRHLSQVFLESRLVRNSVLVLAEDAGSREFAPLVAELLAADDPVIRYRAREVLGNLLKQSVPFRVFVSERERADDLASVRKQLLERETEPPPSKKSDAVLLGRLADADDKVRIRALFAASGCAPDAALTAAVARSFGHKNPVVREFAMMALQALDMEMGAPLFAGELARGDARNTFRAAHCLLRHKKYRTLLPLLKSPDDGLKRIALTAAAGLGDGTKLPDVLASMDTAGTSLAPGYAAAVKALARDEAALKEAVLKLFKKGQPVARAAAVKLAKEFPDARFIPDLIAVLNEGTGRTVDTLDALDALSSPKIKEALVPIAKDYYTLRATLAAKALLAYADDALADDFFAFVKENGIVNKYYLSLVASGAGGEKLDYLLKLDEDKQYRTFVTYALRYSKLPRAVEYLLSVLETQKLVDNGIVTESLAAMGARALPLVRKAFEKTDDISFKVQLVKVMARIDSRKCDEFLKDKKAPLVREIFKAHKDSVPWSGPYRGRTAWGGSRRIRSP